MKFEVKIRKISQELNKETLGQVSNVRKSLDKYRRIKSFGMKIIPSESNALAIIALTHGIENVKSNLKSQRITDKIILNSLQEKLNKLIEDYTNVRVDILHNQFTEILSSPESICLTNERLNSLLDSIKVYEKEKELFFTNLKLADKEDKLYSNHSNHIKNLLVLLNLSLQESHQNILAKTIAKLSTISTEDLADIEAEINITIAGKLKSFMEDVVERKEFNKTKFLNELSKKKKKLIFNVDFYNTHTVLEQKRLIEGYFIEDKTTGKLKPINSKYLILTDGGKVLLDKLKGVELKFFDDRVELYKNNLLVRVSYIIKPVKFEENLNKFLGFNTSLDNQKELEEVKVENAVSSQENQVLE